jgi:rhodanese-related sulfurtransferase
VRVVRNPECAVCGGKASERGGREILAEKEMDITVKELKQRLDEGGGVVLLDIREPKERAIAHIGGLFIPMGELSVRLGELESGAEIVVYCHHGNRSASATAFLRSRGFSRARNLAGGIDRWSREIDPTVPLY